MKTFRAASICALFVAVALIASFALADSRPRAAPLEVIKAYLQAIHARDARAAYRFISAIDRSVRDENTYLGSQENFGGFVLDFAKRVAADMNIWVIEQKLGGEKAVLEVGYRLPTGDEISPRLHGWNPEKLNTLSPAAQAALIEAWETARKDRRPITVEGRETFDLVREKDGWKIFLDWRSRHRVVFKAFRTQPAQLAVEFLRNNFLVKNEEPFQIDFKVTNRGNRNMVVKLDHIFEPRRLEANIDMIACGSLLPLRLRPGETQAISSVYLLRGQIPPVAPLAIVYDFRLLGGAPKSLQ